MPRADQPAASAASSGPKSGMPDVGPVDPRPPLPRMRAPRGSVGASSRAASSGSQTGMPVADPLDRTPSPKAAAGSAISPSQDPLGLAAGTPPSAGRPKRPRWSEQDEAER